MNERLKAVLQSDNSGRRQDYSKDFEILERMEWSFSKGDISFFENVLDSKPSLLLRIHAVCMLADLSLIHI